MLYFCHSKLNFYVSYITTFIGRDISLITFFIGESSLLIRKDEVQEIETEGNISMSQEDDVSYELDDRWLEEANSYEIAMEWSSQWNYTFPIRKPGSTKLKILFWDKFFWVSKHHMVP